GTGDHAERRSDHAWQSGTGAKVVEISRRQSVRAAGDVGRSCSAREIEHAAAATTARAVTFTGISGIRLDEPRVAAVAAMRAHGERRQRSVLRVDDDRAARAAAATSVIQNIERRRAVRFAGAGAVALIRAD